MRASPIKGWVRRGKKGWRHPTTPIKRERERMWETGRRNSCYEKEVRERTSWVKYEL